MLSGPRAHRGKPIVEIETQKKWGQWARVVWEKDALDLNIPCLGKREKEQISILYILAKDLGLPRVPWTGDLLVCRGLGGKGLVSVFGVKETLLGFFSKPSYLEGIQEGPEEVWCSYWANTGRPPIPIVDGKRFLAFKVVYFIVPLGKEKGDVKIEEIFQKWRTLRDSQGLNSEFERGRIVDESWIQRKVTKIVKGNPEG